MTAVLGIAFACTNSSFWSIVLKVLSLVVILQHGNTLGVFVALNAGLAFITNALQD